MQLQILFGCSYTYKMIFIAYF